MMRSGLWRVGELAKRTGVSVRTLHWYEEIGLLSPSQRSEAGHRLYGAEDLERLQQVRSLRQLGFSLHEIRECLGERKFSPQEVIALHLGRLDQEIELQQRLRARLESIAARYGAAEAVSAEEFIQAIEAMTIMEKYYTKEQLEELEQRKGVLGADAIKAVEQEWPQLLAKVRTEMENNTDPADPRVQALAKRWMELLQAFSGGNREIEKSAANMYRSEPATAQQYGVDPKMFPYIQKAIDAGK
ncbi:MAG: MerR family transcriptional regulator, thiopeptide resistance regulator [Thermoanaerobaculia bacterium]|jgi:DNA-binding transcriptional MerR regulator|nr:MerR family transcriptional regulator, thiopeptide resistance regulator [Thermoanaerobaculia bacterium]